MSSVRELLGRRTANAVETGGTGKAKCSTHFMVLDLLDRRETHDGHLSFATEIYIDTPTIVLSFLKVGKPQ